jgi:hypothetical protein
VAIIFMSSVLKTVVMTKLARNTAKEVMTLGSRSKLKVCSECVFMS